MMLAAFNAFAAHAAQEAPRECCGLVLRGGAYWPCRNIAALPAVEFEVHPDDWAAAEDRGEVLAVCHSHPGGSAEPGEADRQGTQDSGIPWFILGADGLQRIDPSVKPLVGRTFEFGWSDCYSLIRDWFLIARGVRLPDFPREERFWETGSSPYLEHFSECGFHEIAWRELQPGDLVLMKIQARTPNHAGVYLGNGRILHHLFNRLSAKDLYNGTLQAATTHVLRLK